MVKPILTIDGYGLAIGFTELLQLVTTSKDYALAVLHASQITIGHTMSSQPVIVITIRCSVAASNVRTFPFLWVPELSLASATSFSQRLNYGCYLLYSLTDSSLTVLVVTSRHGLRRNHHSSVANYGQLPSNGRCLVVFLRMLLSNRSTCCECRTHLRVRLYYSVT
jgi:hypothetical protein